MSVPILTLGYANRSVDDLVALLKFESVQFLIDVRSNPLSKFKPEFSRDTLADLMRRADIRYVFMGDLLGGRPQDPSCYENDHVVYSVVEEKPFFRRGIDRLIDAHTKGLRVSLVCSEARPEDCHRSKLIGCALSRKGIEVIHVGPRGERLSQAEVISRVMTSQEQLFGGGLYSRKAYPFMARRSPRRK